MEMIKAGICVLHLHFSRLPLGSGISWRPDSDWFWEAKLGIRWTVCGFGVRIWGLPPWLIGAGSCFLVAPGSFHLLGN